MDACNIFYISNTKQLNMQNSFYFATFQENKARSKLREQYRVQLRIN